MRSDPRAIGQRAYEQLGVPVSPGQLVEREVERHDLDRRLTEHEQGPVGGVLVDQREDVVDVEAALGGDPGGLEPGVRHRDVPGRVPSPTP